MKYHSGTSLACPEFTVFKYKFFPLNKSDVVIIGNVINLKIS